MNIWLTMVNDQKENKMKHSPEDDYEDYSNEEEWEEDMCVSCNGSGEGSTCESTCTWCKGWGVVYRVRGSDV